MVPAVHSCCTGPGLPSILFKWPDHLNWLLFVDVLSSTAPEPMVNLQFIKNDSYEKGTDLMVVNVYLKGICRDTARVLFREQDFTLIFQTR